MRDRRHVDDRYVLRLDTGRLVVAAVGGGLVLVLVFLMGVFVGRSLWAPPGLPPELAAPPAEGEGSEPAPPKARAEPRTPAVAPARPPEPELTFYRDLKEPPPTKEPEPPEAVRPREKAKPEPPAPKRRRAESPAPAPKRVAPAPVFTVQVGSFRERADAERFLARIRRQGVEAEIVEASVAGRTWYRVQAGRFGSRTAAAEFQESVLGKRGIQGFVTTR